MPRESTRSRIGQKKSNRDSGKHLEHSGASPAHWAEEADQAGPPDAEAGHEGADGWRLCAGLSPQG